MASLPPEVLAEAERRALEAPALSPERRAELRALLRPLPPRESEQDRKAS